MKLVIDTNRIIAALIRDSVSREILLSDKFEFITLSITKADIAKYLPEILAKAKISKVEFEDVFSLLFSKIYVADDIVIKNRMKDAKVIMDKIDADDTPFIALALSIDNSGIWSDDKHFDFQRKVKVWKTKDLVRLLKENFV